jgi:hypothetical protein
VLGRQAGWRVKQWGFKAKILISWIDQCLNLRLNAVDGKPMTHQNVTQQNVTQQNVTQQNIKLAAPIVGGLLIGSTIALFSPAAQAQTVQAQINVGNGWPPGAVVILGPNSITQRTTNYRFQGVNGTARGQYYTQTRSNASPVSQPVVIYPQGNGVVYQQSNGVVYPQGNGVIYQQSNGVIYQQPVIVNREATFDDGTVRVKFTDPEVLVEQPIVQVLQPTIIIQPQRSPQQQRDYDFYHRDRPVHQYQNDNHHGHHGYHGPYNQYPQAPTLNIGTSSSDMYMPSGDMVMR